MLEYYGHVADGAAYPAINPNLIMDIDMIIPDNKTLFDFRLFSEQILNRIADYDQESRTLTAIRDNLLPKLMSGEIPV